MEILNNPEVSGIIVGVVLTSTFQFLSYIIKSIVEYIKEGRRNKRAKLGEILIDVLDSYALFEDVQTSHKGLNKLHRTIIGAYPYVHKNVTYEIELLYDSLLEDYLKRVTNNADNIPFFHPNRKKIKPKDQLLAVTSIIKSNI